MSGTEGAGVLGRRGGPSISPPMRTGVRGAPSTGSSACSGVGGWSHEATDTGLAYAPVS